MLEAQHLVKRFFGVAAVNDVSFAVRRGEVVGYLGPNGSGKTTTFRMLTGLMDASSGKVLFDGKAVDADDVGYRRRLGYVPEEPHLYSFLSGREYLELIGRLREVPAPLLEKKIGALLDLFGMSSAAEQSISAYSKGMRQKILIVGALLHDPEIVIMDEPDSGLDATAALVLRHLVGTLAARGKIVLYSSHVLDVVERLCTRVILIHRGHLVADDSIAQLKAIQANSTLEEVFAQLVLTDDPGRTAADIADVVEMRA